ncbi:MAG: DUF302 domain-containing protein [Bryobacteraceae bacterium]
MLIEAKSAKTLEQIDRDLREAAARQKFGVVAVHDLQQTMRNKGVEFGQACMIYEVCNPHQAKKVLEANGAVSTALPCRISVYGDGDGYRIATIQPTEMMKMFGGAELGPVAEEVERAMAAMVHEAA